MNLAQHRYLSCAETAKLIRADLKAAFPKVKFSVRSSVYSGGASINVRWVDGPSRMQVEEVARRYEGAHFDGSVDLKTYLHEMQVTPEGKIEIVHWGADFVFCERSYTKDFILRVAVPVAREYGIEAEVVECFDGCRVSLPWGGDTYHCERAIHSALDSTGA